jgi:hypothetical protein
MAKRLRRAGSILDPRCPPLSEREGKPPRLALSGDSGSAVPLIVLLQRAILATTDEGARA